MAEQIYKSKVKFKGKFDLKKLYEFLHDLLKNNDWEGIPGEDYYEVYYYHRIAADGSYFIEIQWKATQNFYDEDTLKINWFLTLTIRVDGWNPQTQQGSLEIEIKTEHEIQEPGEPQITTTGEKILSSVFKIKPSWLKKTWGKVRAGDPPKKSAKKLFIHSDELKKEIISFLKGIYA